MRKRAQNPDSAPLWREQMASLEFFFFARVALLSAGKNIIFRYDNGYEQRLDPIVAKRFSFKGKLKIFRFKISC